MHSSLVRRLYKERELEGHQGCVNSIAWNSKGSLLISGSDDTRMNIWSYTGQKLLHSIDTGHSANIFCTKFVPETSDELVVSGAGDAEWGDRDDNSIAPSAMYQCHTRRVKKLAVEVGNPNVVWSASEDGTLRQHDFREGSSCPPTGSNPHECCNILLDLRSGAKRSLADPPKQSLALKSCDISTSRPHLLLVGGRSESVAIQGRSSLHLTHVTFSPNGDEVLLSYSGEHVYLMNVNHSGGTAVRYTMGDSSKLMTFTPTLNVLELQPLASRAFKCRTPSKTNGSSVLEKCRKLVQIAEKSLEEGTDYFYGIEACNEVLDGHGHDIDPTFRHECLCIRAALLLKRKWKNDVHMAIRDCYNARRIDSSSFRALYYMSEALSQLATHYSVKIAPVNQTDASAALGKHKEALEFAIAAQISAPANTEVTVLMENIKKNLAAGEAEKTSKANDGAPRSEPRSGRALSLSDILYRSEANSDASHDGPGSDREDSDYDEELELDFETSVSGDEGRDVEPNILHGSLNLRIHRRGDSTRDSSCTNGSCGSPSSSQNDRMPYQPEAVIDMTQRYVGHCNVGTDIKQASFLGQRGNMLGFSDVVNQLPEKMASWKVLAIAHRTSLCLPLTCDYVASGSDDGRCFIWEKQTGRLIKMLLGDEAVPSAGPEISNVLEAMESNQRRLCQNREAILPFELLERFRMHEFTEGTLHPFECAQS
ncbi:unnamed protein product [Dovyalis caffra]|uniref:WD and tetratricopeptide repeats protein 1 n=1 Tax=Dovyalis caffra TaxID=77055 RepID=A0AAV1SBK0_9ROSI|nr:unnamed protein product [Dovyalis caffra]